MYKILLLLLMIFLHIVDDFYLQGILASMKQKSWWEKNAPDNLYKQDYIMALFIHSFSWSFMIMLVPTIYLLITAYEIINVITALILFFFIINLTLHMIIDDRKANQKEINLIQDQCGHLMMVFSTWFLLIAA